MKQSPKRDDETQDAYVIRLIRNNERDRCAGIARSAISKDTDWDTSYWNQACERIAILIETGK